MAEPIQPEMSTRRGLLRAFARTAARHTREGAEALGPGGLDRLLDSGESSGDRTADAALVSATVGPAQRPARPPRHAASLDELLALAHAEGLTQHDDDLRLLAVRSLRMTPVQPADADAWILTRDAWIPADEWVHLALINLEATAVHDCGLPVKGWLALFVEMGDGTAGPEARHAHGVVLDLPAAIPDGAEPVAFSPELALPRRWHEMVEALGFDDIDAEAYERLRTRLQLVQGVESDDDGGPDIAYHRLLGYPDETTGTMPSDCVRALQDWSAADGAEPDPELASPEWRLFTQISAGDRRRIYVWIRRCDLDAAEFGSLCVFVR